MSFNAQKMANIILNECEFIEERCDKYREKLVETIIAILRLEKEHSVQTINIRQQINDACRGRRRFSFGEKEYNQNN